MVDIRQDEGLALHRNEDGYIDFDETTRKEYARQDNKTSERSENRHISGPVWSAKQPRKIYQFQRFHSPQLGQEQGYEDISNSQVNYRRFTRGQVNYPYPLSTLPGQLTQHPFSSRILPTLPIAAEQSNVTRSDWRGLAADRSYMAGIYEKFIQVRKQFSFNQPEWSEQSSASDGSVPGKNPISKKEYRTSRACLAAIVVLSVLAIMGAIVFAVVSASGKNSDNAPTNTSQFGYNKTCSSSNQCVTPQAICDKTNAKCACPVSHLYDNNQDVCKIIDCGIVPPVKHSNTSADGTKYGEAIRIRCNDGYEYPDGKPLFNTTCKTNGTWGLIPECQPANCSEFKLPNNSKTVHDSSFSYKYLDNVTLICVEGYNLTGTATAVCQSNKTWSETGICNPIRCRKLAPIANSRNESIVDDAVFGETVTIVCSEGYTLNRSSPLKCCENGEWPPIQCEPVLCPNTTSLKNMSMINSPPYVYQNVVNISCDQGYTLTGNDTAICLANASWDVRGSCEPIVCNIFSVPSTSKLEILNNTARRSTFMFEESLLLNCSNGYSLNGSETTSCQANGSWTALPVCTQDCFEPLPSELFTVDSGRLSQGSVRNVTCIPGLSFASGSVTSLTCNGRSEWDGDPECVFPGIITFEQDAYNVSIGSDIDIVCRVSEYPTWQKISLQRLAGYDMNPTAYLNITPGDAYDSFNTSVPSITVFTTMNRTELNIHVRNTSCVDIGTYACVAAVPSEGEPVLQAGNMTVVQMTEIAFNGTCCLNISRCRTQDAVCLNDRCVCDDKRSYDERTDTCTIVSTASAIKSPSTSTMSTVLTSTSIGQTTQEEPVLTTTLTSVDPPTKTTTPSSSIHLPTTPTTIPT
ncbi:hypothetical protein DPMN_138639 [Dreissena polymorpha]|uniref:Sushi domain-containing protein n=1 Tax=Dreissena polymorpha TaxID=45954 RepID=A0A9D4G477_DREPO|nr:hypothetical protein DPMN_138639 [Dreissena polymorpha]